LKKKNKAPLPLPIQMSGLGPQALETDLTWITFVFFNCLCYRWILKLRFYFLEDYILIPILYSKDVTLVLII